MYNVFADVNFLKNNRASLIVQKAFSGFNGPWDNYFGDRVGANNLSAFRGTQMVPSIVGLDQWMGDFSNRYSLEGELAKLRYRFSETRRSRWSTSDCRDSTSRRAARTPRTTAT